MKRNLMLAALGICLLVAGYLLGRVGREDTTRHDPARRTATEELERRELREETMREAEEEVATRTPGTTAQESPSAVPKSTSRKHTATPVSATPKPWEVAEETGDPTHGSLRVLVDDRATPPHQDVNLRVAAVVEGKHVTFHDEPVDPSGRVEIARIPPGRRVVSLRAGGASRVLGVDVKTGRVTEVRFVLPPGYEVSGLVRHEEKGPLADIEVKIRFEKGDVTTYYRAQTDDAGRFRLTGLPEGTWPVSLTGRSIGYHPSPRGEVVVKPPGPVLAEFVLGRVVLGGVVQDETGRAVANVRVSIGRPLYVDVTTDASGRFGFRDVPPGRYVIYARKQGLAPDKQEAEVGPGSEDREVRLVLGRAAALLVRVLDVEGNPIPGEHILSRSRKGARGSSAGNLIFDAKGELRYDQLAPGTWTLGIRADGYQEGRKQVDLGAGPNEVEFRLERKADADAGPISLTGTVRSAETGAPIAGARIQIQSPRHASAVTDANGVYRFRNLPQATCTLWIGLDGFGTEFFRDVVVKAGEESSRDFELTPAGVLHLHVTNAKGEPVVGRVILSIHPVEGTTGTRMGTSTTADEHGHAVFRKIVPGSYTISASQGSLGRGEGKVTITRGENTLHLQLR